MKKAGCSIYWIQKDDPADENRIYVMSKKNEPLSVHRKYIYPPYLFDENFVKVDPQQEARVSCFTYEVSNCFNISTKQTSSLKPAVFSLLKLEPMWSKKVFDRWFLKYMLFCY